MTDTDQTPGPWRIEKGDGIPARWQIWGGADTIATLSFPDNGCDTANARLIAAAPKLLDALRMVLEVGLADEDGAEHVEAMIYAAIAKAEGRNDE